MNPTKAQCMSVSRSRTAFPPHPDLFIDDVPLALCDSLKVPGVIFDNKFTFGQHLCSVSSSVAQKIGLLRKFMMVFGISQSYRNVLILFCRVWSITHLFGVLQLMLILDYWIGI